MPLTGFDKDQVKKIVIREMESRTNVINQLKGHGMDRREDKMVEIMAFSEKNDDDGPPIGSYPPVAT